MQPLIPRNLWQWIEENREAFEPPVGNKVVWEDSQYTAMVIRGPNARRDFHIDPSDEIVAIKNLRTGQGVLIDPDTAYEAASLFKLPVMYEVFKQREARLLTLDEELVFTERHVSYDLGTLDRPAGSSIRLGEALERMITLSDNSSAVLLTDRVGAFAVNQDLTALGMSQTHVLLESLTTSPLDMLRLLEMVALGEAVNPRASNEMIQLMAQQRVNDRLPSRLPPGTLVAHKTGNLPSVVNDVGIVYGPGGPFVVAVLVDETSDEAAAARATADIALLAYNRFNVT